MKVFKFGGASLKDAASVRNMASIIEQHGTTKLVIIVSAMAKTTNALEQVWLLGKQNAALNDAIQVVADFHRAMINELFDNPESLLNELDELVNQIHTLAAATGDDDWRYDQVVSLGEIISSKIVFHYLRSTGINCQWMDARKIIHTDSTYREGTVDWEATTKNMLSLKQYLSDAIVLTQGFIGGNQQGESTTLGREGSDFTAAIVASCLDAESVTIWKDVPGVMNADPKRLPAAIVFKELPYKEAAEMTYYGASVIHPKTIKPLALKGIPLFVKSFQDPSLHGTKIHECTIDQLPPLTVFKDNQCLVSCKVTDYTFVNEQQLSLIFHALTELNIKVNVMQNSAISFSFCVDYRENKLEALIEKLRHHFEVYYNTNLTLITVKNYDEPSFETYRRRAGVLLEQSSRSTLQMLVKE